MSTLPGAAIWFVLAGVLAAWIGVTTVARGARLPTIVDVACFWLESWVGRLVLLALWAEAGFHVLTQHP